MDKLQKGLGKLLSCVLALCLMLTVPAALAEDLQTELESVYPLLDLVCSAASQLDDGLATLSPDFPMSQEMAGALFAIGSAIPATKMPAASDAAAQTQYLQSNFSEGTVFGVTAAEGFVPAEGYTGFRPMASDTGAEAGSIQVVGEVYHAAKPYRDLTADEKLAAKWDEPAVFLLKTDDTALFGYRIISFSFGSVISMESVMADYFTSILMEYENNSLGFSVQYPALFDEDTLTDDESGLYGKLPSGEASFFATRKTNDAADTMDSLKAKLEQQPNVKSVAINADFGYLTVQTLSEDGTVSFDVYIVTADYLYQANLTYKQEFADKYQMYTTYLENSFIAFEVSVG